MTEVAKLRLAVESMGVKKAQRELNKLSKEGKIAEAQLGKTAGAGKMLKASMIGLIGGLAGVTLVVKKVVGEWLKFDKAMTEVSTIAGVTDKRMKELRKSALLLSESLGVDATEAAQGFYQALSAGVAETEVEEFMGTAAKFAQAAMTDIATATDLLTTALNSYNLEASEAERVSDMLFATIKLGKTNGEQLAKSFARASGAASNGGVQMSELLATIAQLTKKGVVTAEAFTQVKAAIQALFNPSKELQTILDQLGVSSSRQLIEQKGLAGALDAVVQATKGSDATLVKALRSSEAYNGALFLTSQNLADVKDLQDEIIENQGAVDEASDKVGELLEKRVASLKASFLILNEELEDTTGVIDTISGSIYNMGYLLQAWREFLQNPDAGDFGQAFVETLKLATTNIADLGQAWQDLGGITATTTEEFERQHKAANAIYSAGVDTTAVAQRYFEVVRQIADLDITSPMETREELEKQLATQERLLGRLNESEQAEVRRQVAIEKSWQEQQKGLKTVEEHFDTVENINAAYKKQLLEIQKNLKGERDKTKAIDDQKRLQDLLTKASELYLKEQDQVLLKLRDEEQVFLQILEINKVLTVDEQKQLDLIRERISARKEENKEAAKTPQQRAYEGVVESLLTDKERASRDRAARDAAIRAGGATPEEQAIQLERSARRYEEDLESTTASGGAAPKAIDEQTSIDQQVEKLQQYYMTELELQLAHEQEKRDLIMEATNLTGQEREDLLNQLAEDGKRQRIEIAKAETAMKLEAAGEFFGGMASLASAFGKKGFKTYQALAIAEATVSTFLSASKALAAYPPPYSYIAAAGAVASGLAQVAKIKQQQPPAYQMGGIVGGNSYGGDQELARVNSGEMILNQQQQRNLFAMANNPLGGSNSSGNVTIINNTRSEFEAETKTNKEGDMEIIVKEAVQQAKFELTNEAQEGGGEFLPALEQSYGLQRK